MEPTTYSQASTAGQTTEKAGSRESEYTCDVEDDNEAEDEDDNDEADNTVCEGADQEDESYTVTDKYSDYLKTTASLTLRWLTILRPGMELIEMTVMVKLQLLS